MVRPGGVLEVGHLVGPISGLQQAHAQEVRRDMDGTGCTAHRHTASSATMQIQFTHLKHLTESNFCQKQVSYNLYIIMHINSHTVQSCP